MVRRVVTGVDDAGKPTIVHDGEPPRSRRFTHIPRMAPSVVWTTGASAEPSADGTVALERWIPGPGETLALAITFPPDRDFADPALDLAAAVAEQMEAQPGLAELF